MLGGVQFETGGVGPVPYLNILGGTSQKNHPVSRILALARKILVLFIVSGRQLKCGQSQAWEPRKLEHGKMGAL